MNIKPVYEALAPFTTRIPRRIVEQYIHSLDSLYFSSFTKEDIGKHLHHISRLSPSEPVQISILPGFHNTVECTVLTYDSPFLFSFITGILSQVGFDIKRGFIFTSSSAKQHKKHPILKPDTAPHKGESRRFNNFVIDYFIGTLNRDQELNLWSAEISKIMKNVLALLFSCDPQSFEQAKQIINEMVADKSESLSSSAESALLPVDIELDASYTAFTHIRIRSPDTPFFLYSLSSAFSLAGVSIQQVHIDTVAGLVIDDFYLSDLSGKRINDPVLLDKIRFSILLTKQFTYFLGNAPHPYAALTRFESMIRDLVIDSDAQQWLAQLQQPLILKELAQVLGTSDFLWEDFIRGQYETLISLLAPHNGIPSLEIPFEILQNKLILMIEKSVNFEQKIFALNQFKDEEIFRIDILHILNPALGFSHFSKNLTELAELVVSTALEINLQEICRRYGRPLTAAGNEARYGLFGCGKFGGAAIGYASDIEILFVYSDMGTTSGPEKISNSDFFELLIRNTALSIKTKRDGIFHIDMRLRPYGDDGTLAVSLELFIDYYGKTGSAHAAERLALVRMRAISGDLEFCARIERLRDELIYQTDSINPADIFSLRERQSREKTWMRGLNAKFSPGALVDLEYTVQLLQTFHAHQYENLKTPRLHDALNALHTRSILGGVQAERLKSAYDFFRLLINGLRMLRGSAQDLFLPDEKSHELLHLARRIGYRVKGDISAQQQLLGDFETYTAYIRSFINDFFGTEFVPSPYRKNIADFILSEITDETAAISLLSGMGFQKPLLAYRNFKNLAGKGQRKDLFSRFVVLAADIISRLSDPDMALNNWELFSRRHLSLTEHLTLLWREPERLFLLLNIFSVSHFLSETLIRHPEFFDELFTSEDLEQPRTPLVLVSSLNSLLNQINTETGWLDVLRLFRRKEMLRIGIRDIHLQKPLPGITQELTQLAEELIRAALDKLIKLNLPEKTAETLTILAFGKLGGRELNYSSDIDLLCITLADNDQTKAETLMRSLIHDLAFYTDQGHVYRVDMRLRPHGMSGQLVLSYDNALDYYRREARLWEIQALLKLRPVAGNFALGDLFVNNIRPLLLQRRADREIKASISSLRKKTIHELSLKTLKSFDIKNSTGGIRDIEFLVQGLSLIHAHDHPRLITGNTIEAIEALHETAVFKKEEAQQLILDYLFLRKVEHYLQIYEDVQTHTIPDDQHNRETLAKRILGIKSNFIEFNIHLAHCTQRVHRLFQLYIDVD